MFLYNVFLKCQYKKIKKLANYFLPTNLKEKMMNFYAKITSSGSYLPHKIMTNQDLEKIVETSDEWIVQRTGISKRHIASEKETTSFMAAEALKNAINKGNLSINDIDCIIIATTTPDLNFPSTACIVQGLLGAKNAFCFDVQAVCSGFVYALSLADNFIKCGKTKNVAVIGADKLSSIVDWKDRNTCVLFGDGAGCVILSKTEEKTGVLDYILESDGNLCDILKTNEAKNGKNKGCVEMNGREVFRYATGKMSENLHTLLERNQLQTSDLSAIICHQANARILEYVAEKAKLDISLFPKTLENHGNTSAASIPLALDSWIGENKIKKGDIIALLAVGGGMTSGGALIKY